MKQIRVVYSQFFLLLWNLQRNDKQNIYYMSQVLEKLKVNQFQEHKFILIYSSTEMARLQRCLVVKILIQGFNGRIMSCH